MESHVAKMEPLLDKGQAARFLNKKQTWIAYAVRHGLLEYVRVGQQLRFRRESLEKYIAANTHPAKRRRER